MKTLIAFLVFCFLTGPASAQEAMIPQSSTQPLEITAQKTLEWRRNDKQYVARGQAVAKQGDVSIAGETLTADYRESKKSNTEIFRLTAEGSVRIVSQGSTAEGDKAVYEVDKGLATMTGSALRLSSPEQTVTAKDRFEYWVPQGRLNAIGRAHAVRGEDVIDSDTMSAIFRENTMTKKRELSKLEAAGHVVITTPTEILRGDRGDYDATTNVATLDGNVSIKRGPNILEGESADVNLTTNISRMHGGTGEGGRVRGVFYPNSDKSLSKQP